MTTLTRPLLLVALMLLAACGTVGVIESDNVTETTTTLTERFDGYVEADESLTDDEKVERLSRSASVRTYFKGGEPVPVKPIYGDTVLVLDWHDAYINADEALADFERRLALFESKALRGAVDEAMKRVE